MKKIEELQDCIKKLKETRLLIIVEGPKDKKSLQPLTKAPILTLSKKPLFQIIEDIAKKHDEIILLTDFDKEGKKLYGKLSKECKRQGIKINNKIRELLLKTELSHIEGFVTYLKNKEK